MGAAFSQIFDLLVQFIDSFRFLRIVKVWEVAVVLRWGRYHRTLSPGLHFILPFHIETVAAEWTVPYPRQLAPQPLTTSDGASVVVTAVVTTRCVDAQRLVCQSGGHENAILDSAGGTIAQLVARAQWPDLVKPAFQAAMVKAMNEASMEWGLETMRVQFVQLSRARPVVLVGHKPTDL